jgi:hypothetical protein
MSVPFIIAIGTGLASIRTDGSAEEDSFGLTALCSIGPIVAVMILGIIFQPEDIKYVQEEVAIDFNSTLRSGIFGSKGTICKVYSLLTCSPLWEAIDT